MEEVKQYDKHTHMKPSDTDYGFHHPVELARRLYWQRRTSQAPVYAEHGALLDQDAALETDVRTYAWLTDIAEGILAEEKEALARLKGRGR